MGFLNGRVTFTRYRVSGPSPLPFGDDTLALAEAHAIGRHGAADPTDGVQTGWAGGDHVLDLNFDLAKNVVNDALHLAIRIDTDKIPGSLLAGLYPDRDRGPARQNPSGHPTKAQRQEAKEAARIRAEAEAADGRFRRLNHYPVLWDGQTGILYAGSTSTTVLERLQTLFRETFDRQLEPITAGSLAMSLAGPDEADRTDSGEGGSSLFGGEERELSTVAWAENAPNMLDHLGNEFLVWLWHTLQNDSDTIAPGRRLRGRGHARQDADPRLPPRRDRPRQPDRRRADPAAGGLPGPSVRQAPPQGGADPGAARRPVRADPPGRDPGGLWRRASQARRPGALRPPRSGSPGSIACAT